MINWILIVLIVALIWILLHFRHANHRFWTFLWLVLIIFFILTVFFVFKDREVDLQSVDGFKTAFGVYLNWFGSAFQNIKVLTGSATQMDWRGNSTETK